MSSAYRAGKLLICFVGRHRGERLVDITKKAGARGGTIALGKTIDSNSFLRAFALADVPQDVVFTLMGSETAVVVNAVKAAAAASNKKLVGMGILLDVSGLLVRTKLQEQETYANELDTESIKMESGYTLLTVIVNDGYAEDVMAVARKAGATGGTILTARGTGTEEDVKFFGISLVPEKDMLMIVTAKDSVNPIITALKKVPHLCEPGGGIAYTMNVEEFISL